MYIVVNRLFHCNMCIAMILAVQSYAFFLLYESVKVRNINDSHKFVQIFTSFSVSYVFRII